MNDQERLELAVRFAQADLSTMREGDWLNLRDDLRIFLARDLTGSTGLTPLEHLLPGEYSQDDFVALQKDFHRVLNDLVTRRGGGIRTGITVPVKLTFGMAPFGNAAIVGFKGAIRAMFLFRLFLLLDREPSNRILVCKAPDCERIFYRKRKQKYCSSRCQSRDFMRRFRKENGDKESEQNHKRYKIRVEKSRGRPTKVARRPRRRKNHGNR